MIYSLKFHTSFTNMTFIRCEF